MSTASWRVTVGDGTTSALYEPAHGKTSRAVFVCAHGAGGHMLDRGMQAVADTMRSAGLDVVRYNFPYREKESSRPDPMPRLMECVAAVAAHTRRELDPEILLIGGRSMGGRAASMLAAERFDCGGLLLLAYPLHPSGLPDQRRDAHLPSIRVPVLCFNGTRDALCRKDLMDKTVRSLRPTWTMHWLEGADHSFHVLRSSGRTDAQIFDEVGASTSSWVDMIRKSGRAQ